MSPQAAYIKGNIRDLFGGPDIPYATRYVGKSEAYSGGLSYTSPSIGPVSLFLFGIYAKSRSDFDGLEVGLQSRMSDRCMAFDLSGNILPCVDTIDNSFASVGASVALWGFGVSIYSRVWAKIDIADVQKTKYEASFSMTF